ncbi:MAG: hypothetical protein U0136_04550 [Bdellovibrionota bacterium]
MTKENTSKALFALSKTDAEVVVVSQRKNEIQERRAAIVQEIERLKKEIQDAETKNTQLRTRHQLEQERLSSEEKKIVERRKQLTALGGTKGAKLVEREIDIAARTLQTMEQKAQQALEDVEQLAKKMEASKVELDAKQLELENAETEDGKLLGELDDRLGQLEERRSDALSGIDDRTKNLYQRVRSRYPGGAIAIAEAGSCRSCFRALPAQTYNQVLSGNLLQCPSCSRILIAVGPEEV